jgi:hypothetical protein
MHASNRRMVLAAAMVATAGACAQPDVEPEVAFGDARAGSRSTSGGRAPVCGVWAWGGRAGAGVTGRGGGSVGGG